MTDDFRKIEEDESIRVVVETIGGVEAAYEYTKRALQAGKHVVTANKQLVAERGCELLELARKKNVSYLFEASVGGGIPVLHPLTQCMAANRIDEVYGILNGTTNYILSRMVRTGAFFSDALREAQAKGYAEADPTADVEGIDAGRKICILADLAFGYQVDPAVVPMEGISRLSLRDVKIAQRAGYRIKLLGRAVRMPGGGRTAYVAPHLIPEDNPDRQCGGCVQRRDDPGKCHRRCDVLRQGRRRAAYRFGLRGGCDGVPAGQPPAGRDRLGADTTGLCGSGTAAHPLLFPH